MTSWIRFTDMEDYGDSSFIVYYEKFTGDSKEPIKKSYTGYKPKDILSRDTIFNLIKYAIEKGILVPC